MKIRVLLLNLIFCFTVFSACSTQKTTQSNNMESYRGCVYIVQYEDVNYVVQEVVYHPEITVEPVFKEVTIDIEDDLYEENAQQYGMIIDEWLSQSNDPCKSLDLSLTSMTRRIIMASKGEKNLELLEKEILLFSSYEAVVSDNVREVSENKEIEIEYLGIYSKE